MRKKRIVFFLGISVALLSVLLFYSNNARAADCSISTDKDGMITLEGTDCTLKGIIKPPSDEGGEFYYLFYLEEVVLWLINNRIVYFLWLFAGVIAIFFIVFSGFKMATSFGKDDQFKKGMSGLKNAIIGLLVVILSYPLIVNILKLIFERVEDTGS